MGNPLGERRMGRIFVGRKTIEFSPHLLRSIQRRLFIILEAEHNWSMDGVWYTAISKQFDPIPIGGRAPEYNIVYDSGTKGISFARIS